MEQKLIYDDMPRHLPKEAYDRVCALARAELSATACVASAYVHAGNEQGWVPGISDLDILVVLKPDAQADIRSPFSLSDDAGYIFTHGYAVYDEHSFKRLFDITPDFVRLELLLGEPVAVCSPRDEMSAEEYRDLQAAILFSLFMNKIAIFPLRARDSVRRTRRILGELHSLSYTLRMIETISGERLHPEFPARIQALRASWFNQDDKTRLPELETLLDEGVAIVCDTAEALHRYTRGRIGQVPQTIFRTDSVHAAMIDGWSKEQFLTNLYERTITIRNPFSGRRLRDHNLMLPTSFAWYLGEWAAGEGRLSDHIRERFSGTPSVHPVRGFARHVSALNGMALDGAERGGIKLPFPFGFSFGHPTVAHRIGIFFLRILRIFR